MRSQSLSTIPVIDLSNEGLKPGTNTWVSTCQEIRLAMEEFGCFEAIYSKVSLELHNQVFGTTEELFDLPTEIKMKNTSTKPYFDYFGQYSYLPLYESLGIDNPTTLESTQSFTNLMWSFGNDRFWYAYFLTIYKSYFSIFNYKNRLKKKGIITSVAINLGHYY